MTKRALLSCFPLVSILAIACGGGADRASRTVLQNKGSDTLVNVAQAWAENYKDVDPNVAIAVTGGGSGTGISAMINGTVDIANATWTNTIGASELIGVWSDPEFDATVSASYYARVMEIPTPRWTAHEAKRFGITMDEEIPMVTTERAYTSPIWYSPDK